MSSANQVINPYVLEEFVHEVMGEWHDSLTAPIDEDECCGVGGFSASGEDFD